MTDGEAVFSPDGDEYLGTLRLVEDGSAVLLSDDGEILSALDPDGNPADPADFQVEGGAPPPASVPPVADLMPEPPQYQPGEAYRMGQEASGHRAEEQWAVSTGRELRNLEQALGRSLTQTEAWKILEEHHADFAHGVAGTDISDAVGRAGIIEFSPGQDFGEGEHEHAEGRRQYMRQLVEDSQRTERGETPDDLPPRVEPASSDEGDVRRARLTNLANGHADPGPGSGEEGME